MTDPPSAATTDWAGRRLHAERQAVAVFAVGAVTMAIVCGAVIVSKWFAGVMDDRFERFFWAGAVIAWLMVMVLAAACFPGGRDDRRTTRRVITLTRIGIVLYIIAPTLCIGSLIADFYVP